MYPDGMEVFDSVLLQVVSLSVFAVCQGVSVYSVHMPKRIIIIYFNCKLVLTCGSGTTIRRNTQIKHIIEIIHCPQAKQCTHNYTNNKGHTTHSEYNVNTIDKYCN
jgi:hypothetical protein